MLWRGMPERYPIYEVRNASTARAGVSARRPLMAIEQQQDEQMGSKRKFWLCDNESARWFLFKFSRSGTGEHWSEKIACEVARVLGLPHARVELATHDGASGVLVEDLRRDRERMSLLHGNELLLELDPKYPSARSYRASEHTPARVEHALSVHAVELPTVPTPLPAGVTDAMGLFVGYLLLDALIGNTDRHHENWAVVVERSASGARHLELAATYDHASSLGRELDDAKRLGRIQSDKLRGMQGYVERARSALYRAAGDSKPLSPRDAFLAAGELRPSARDAWLARCKTLGAEALVAPLDALPPDSASEAGVAFARKLIRYSWTALLDPREDLP
jgi:HipA-like C-terminal domain